MRDDPLFRQPGSYAAVSLPSKKSVTTRRALHGGFGLFARPVGRDLRTSAVLLSQAETDTAQSPLPPGADPSIKGGITPGIRGPHLSDAAQLADHGVGQKCDQHREYHQAETVDDHASDGPLRTGLGTSGLPLLRVLALRILPLGVLTLRVLALVRVLPLGVLPLRILTLRVLTLTRVLALAGVLLLARLLALTGILARVLPLARVLTGLLPRPGVLARILLPLARVLA